MGKDVAELFIEHVKWFPGVEETRGEIFGERSLRIEGRAFLCVHECSTICLLLSTEAKAEAMKRGLAQQHPCGPPGGIVELRLQRDDQLGAALGLAKQSYDYVRGRIQEAAALATNE